MGVFFWVICMCCVRLHYLRFWSFRVAVVVLYCEIMYYSRELASGPYPEPPEFSQRSYILFNFHFNFPRNSTCGCPKLYVPSVYPI